ncbi:MAG: STAS domain-containing protein [Pseudomonadaceae bacterium]|nr:STAS domain-containing protein [Pseudomonadaceae bacterium]
MSGRVEIQSDDRFSLCGDVEFDEVGDLKKQGLAAVADASAEHDKLSIDLAQLSQSNSVTVALMLAWLREGKTRGVAVNFTSVPPAIGKILEFSGLSSLVSYELAS